MQDKMCKHGDLTIIKENSWDIWFLGKKYISLHYMIIQINLKYYIYGRKSKNETLWACL